MVYYMKGSVTVNNDYHLDAPGLTRFHEMHFDHTHFSPNSSLTNDAPYPPTLCLLYLSPWKVVCGTHMFLDVGPSTGAWSIYQGLNA